MTQQDEREAMYTARYFIEEVLTPAGITINGTAPYDIHIHDERFYNRVLSSGTLGLGESYVDGWWDVDALDVFFTRIVSRELPAWIIYSPPALLRRIINELTNLPQWRAFHIGKSHYDIGNDLYKAMLGSTMSYSCAYWRMSKTLDEAQTAKYDLVCRKLGLQKGHRLLDIGCGWGGLAQYAAEHYGASVVGVTVSREQERLASKFYKGQSVEIRYQNYRDLRDHFDRIVSIGMFEHVGYKNYRTFMEVVRNSLNDNGLFLLHTIGTLKSVTDTDPWVEQYIFPDAKLPSLAQIAHATEGTFVIEDLENIGANYDPTLMAWCRNFDAAWPQLQSRYNKRFQRLWRYYLLMCAGLFRARRQQVWQLVLSKQGAPGGYYYDGALQ